MKLRDLSVAEKQEREKRIKELERENKKLPALQEKLEKLQMEHNAAQKELEELKEALDAAGEAEQMIEQLTEKNLNYEDVTPRFPFLDRLSQQIRELEATVSELEQLRDMSEELEENQAAFEKQLRSELCEKAPSVLPSPSQTPRRWRTSTRPGRSPTSRTRSRTTTGSSVSSGSS